MIRQGFQAVCGNFEDVLIESDAFYEFNYELIVGFWSFNCPASNCNDANCYNY